MIYKKLIRNTLVLKKGVLSFSTSVFIVTVFIDISAVKAKNKQISLSRVCFFEQCDDVSPQVILTDKRFCKTI